MAEFKVNDYTTIKNFQLLSIFEKHLKFGKLYDYEKFKGTIKGQKVSGLICLQDDNIYKLKKL